MMHQTTTDDVLKSTAVRRVGDRIGGYGAVWGDAQHTDLEGTYFTPATDFWLDHYTNQPIFFDHAMSQLPDDVPDDMPRQFKFGQVVKVARDAVGLWIEAVITEHNQWVDAVLTLIDRGVLHWSSGSVPHLVTQEADGWLSSWPAVEWSSTHHPAEPRNTHVVRLKHYVNAQDSGPDTEATAVEAAHAPGNRPVNRLAINHRKGQAAMTLNLNEGTVKALVSAYASANEADVLAAVDAVKAEGGGDNMIAQALQPLADELAGMAGATVEDTLAYLISWVADHAAGASEPEPEEAPLEELMSEPTPTTLSAPDNLQTVVDAAVAKAMQGHLPAAPRGAALTPQQRNVRLNGRAVKPLTLGTWIKAIASKDHEVLKRHHPVIKAQYKALGIDPDTAGGYLVPVEQSNQVIELLRDIAKVLPLCRTMPMNSATLPIPEQTGGATAYWVGENASITESEETFGQKLLVAKKMAVLVKLSNELLDDADPSIDALIREDIARVAALETDRVILEGAGTASQPLGIYSSGVTRTDLNATPTYAHLSGAVSRVEVENVLEDPQWTWVFHPRLKDGLRLLEDSAGNLIYAGPGAYQQSLAGPMPGTLLGYPFATTTQITVDTGTSNQSDMYFGQWNDVIVGQRKTLEIMASNEADTAFAADQTWIRAILRLDVVVRHVQSIEVLQDAQ